MTCKRPSGAFNRTVGLCFHAFFKNNNSELLSPPRALRLLFKVANRGERGADLQSSQREYPGATFYFLL